MLIYAVFILNAVVILGFWWFSSGFEIARNASDAFNGIGRVTGLLGTYLVLWQLLFMARLPWLEHAFGLERMAVLHKWNGYLAIGLLIGHAVFQTGTAVRPLNRPRSAGAPSPSKGEGARDLGGKGT
jgi:predicted ferric reductase